MFMCSNWVTVQNNHRLWCKQDQTTIASLLSSGIFPFCPSCIHMTSELLTAWLQQRFPKPRSCHTISPFFWLNNTFLWQVLNVWNGWRTDAVTWRSMSQWLLSSAEWHTTSNLSSDITHTGVLVHLPAGKHDELVLSYNPNKAWCHHA